MCSGGNSGHPIYGKQAKVTQERCKKCGSPVNDISTIIPVNEVYDPQTVRYLRHHYECSNCSNDVIATSSNCPSEGGTGTNLLAQMVLFRYEYRMPYRKITQLIHQLYEIDIDKSTVLHSCERMADMARLEYEQIKQQIRSSEVLYIDETPHLVDGVKNWLWAFTTGQETLYMFRETRSTKVLYEGLGDDFTGTIVCDGHQAYSAYHSRLQRCWTHLLRGTDSLQENDTEAWTVYSRLFEIFNGLKTFLQTKPTLSQRLVVGSNAREELERLVGLEVESEDAGDVLTMLENGLGHWLTFVEEPIVKPTNNTVEAILREPIVIRRIIGQLKNKKGMRLHETFLSLLRTWKQKSVNPYSELRRIAQMM